MKKKEMPLGVFDSGIGGLTVLKEIFNSLPLESTIYLGDTARVPYGIRSPETVARYSFECTRFLLQQEIKLLAVACNTVSAVSLNEIRERISIPVVGVIEPGARAAVRSTKNGRVGVIGTDATIKSGAYHRAIRALDGNIEVFGLCPRLFVPIAEEGWVEGQIVELIARKYLDEIKDKGIDILVLGCTHYPLLKRVLSAVLGENIKIIDSAIETAVEIKSVLSGLSLLREGDPPLHKFYITDSDDRFIKVGEHFLGERIEHIQKVEIGAER